MTPEELRKAALEVLYYFNKIIQVIKKKKNNRL